MTISGAISDLNNLLKADDIPAYYKPSIQKIIETIALEQSNSDKDCKWISVTERLPEQTGLYLVSIGDLVSTYPFDGYNFKLRQSNVTVYAEAWMKLPKPYNGIEEEK